MRLPRLQSAVPQTWPVRMEIARAIRTLKTQIEGDHDQVALRDLYEALLKAEFNPDEPRVPAGNPDGGQWTSDEGSDTSGDQRIISDAAPEKTWIPGAQYAANDPPRGTQQPSIPQEKPTTPQAVNTFIKATAYFLAGATLAGEPAGEFILVLEATDWVTHFLPGIYSYLDAPKSLEELQAAAQNTRPGYNVLHIVEQTQALQDGFPPSVVNSPENLVLVPILKHWLITAWFATRNDNFGGLSPRDYLRGKSWEERMQVGKQALIDLGVLVP